MKQDIRIKYIGISAGLLLGLVYSTTVYFLFNRHKIENPQYRIVPIKEIINDRNVLEPIIVIEYNDEKIVYLNEVTESYHNFYKNHLYYLMFFIIILYVLVDIMFFPVGRSSEGWTDFFQFKSIAPTKRNSIRKNINNILLGLAMSLIISICILPFFKKYDIQKFQSGRNQFSANNTMLVIFSQALRINYIIFNHPICGTRIAKECY
jgi:hypothetical protein